MADSINTEMIESLKDLMEDDFPILIETFLTDCDKRIVDLNLAIAEGNAVEVRELAHGFKGSSSNLGAEELANICFTLETMGRTDDLGKANDIYLQLNDEYQTVKKYFNSIG